MVTTEIFRKIALSFPGVEEMPHFDRAAFKARVIFATLHESSRTANIKFNEVDQSVFCEFEKGVFPVPNKWGQQGWTTFELDKVPEELVKDALETAYRETLNKKK
ncbi:MAG: MmcQ/YjbR family DNA-binding protein [Imperialibacter sp.]|uniref:MmcQ/YjbR family DNA-binding protein n=1 Tax=Imperialibacter sp. TaxID=2038411 RepID=UPI0032EED6BC